MSTIVYKIKHKPTGLFYQPVKGRWSNKKSNLGKRGKLYETLQYPKNLHKTSINISDIIYNKYKSLLVVDSFDTKNSCIYLHSEKEDWEIVSFNLVEVKT